MSESIIIRKQKFRIKTNNEQLALQLRKQVNDELQYSLLPVYEEALGKLNTDGETIFIDKIIVDLGRCNTEEFKQRLPAMLKEALIKQLNDPLPGKGLIQEEPVTTKRKRSATENMHDEITALFYFLENGIYSWWYTGSSGKTPKEIIAVMNDSAIENLLMKIISIQNIETKNVERINERFIQNLSSENHKKVITGLIALQSDQQVKRNLEILIAEETVNYLISHTGINEEIYRQQVIRFLLEKSSANHENILKMFILFLFKRVSNSKELFKFYKENKKSSQKENIIEELVGDITEQEKQSAIRQFDEEQHVKKKTTINQPAKETIPDEGIYIDNGGLVILHPFLQPLFSNLGLIDAGSFISAKTQYKAVVVLYYLQNQGSLYEEYEMAFNKLLCGMAIDEVLPTNIELSEKEKQECNELLQTVINYWEALKGASTEALQETFIRRKAKLNFKEDHWRLQVEKNATDILLNRLPWGVGVIKLPWLQYLIHVEW